MAEGDEMGVGLADAIGQVRVELEEAIRRGAASGIAFRAGPVEMEFEIGLQRSASADGGVRLWVVSAGGRGEVSAARTHRLKISLTPVHREGQADVFISDTGPG